MPKFLLLKSDGPISGFAKNGDAIVKNLLNDLGRGRYDFVEQIDQGLFTDLQQSRL